MSETILGFGFEVMKGTLIDVGWILLMVWLTFVCLMVGVTIFVSPFLVIYVLVQDWRMQKRWNKIKGKHAN